MGNPFLRPFFRWLPILDKPHAFSNHFITLARCIHFWPNIPRHDCSCLHAPICREEFAGGIHDLKSQSFTGVQSTCSTEILLSKAKVKLFAHMPHQCPIHIHQHCQQKRHNFYGSRAKLGESQTNPPYITYIIHISACIQTEFHQYISHISDFYGSTPIENHC